MPKESGMRVPNRRRDGNAVGQDCCSSGLAKDVRRVLNFRQAVYRNAEQVTQISIPSPFNQIKQLGARSIRLVGCVDLAAG